MGSPFLLSLGAAAAAGAAFLFLMELLWRRLVKRHSVSIGPAASQSGGQAAHDHPPYFDRPNDEMPAIFLSHSGVQKPFVENLYSSLRHTNHTSFFDQESLSKAKPFPAHIKRAAHGCKLGVIVLSEDFLTSKWPMMELKILVLDRGDDPDVLPLFYKLSPQDLKSHENLCRWRRVWKEMAGQDAEKWELAVRKLRGFNGEVFIPRTSEAAYIKKIVQLINNIIPNHSLYDLSQIKGHQRLAQEVAGRFEHANATEVCVVGLHGVGGLGKTTVCHIMVNFYNSMYLGRSCLVELPSDGNDKMIVQECKKALKRLTHLGNEFLLSEADMSLSEVVELMRKNMSRHDVFLAIDNVSERSLEAVKNIVSAVSFSAKSRVLVTSRSEQVLKDALRRLQSKFSHIGPLPAPAHEEAFQIFQDMVELGDLDSLVADKEQLNKVLERCKFSGDYHALALKALGQYVQRECAVKGLTEIDHYLSIVLKKVRIAADMENVEDAIRLNYENLSEKKRHVFLDIAVSFMQAVPRPFGLPYTGRPFVGLTSAKACQWLSFLYKGEFPEHMIADLIYKFALGGLIQLEKIDGRDGSVIRVHDLYLDLAQREAVASPRFLTDRSITPVEEIEWKRLERVISLPARYRGHLLVEKCPKLRVLYINGGWVRTVRLDLMPSLCVLKLANVHLAGIESWSAAKDLAVVQLYSLRSELVWEPIPRLVCLEELIVENCMRVDYEARYENWGLKELVLVEPSSFKEAEKLQSLHVEHLNGSSTRDLDMGVLILLQTLRIQKCGFVERIRGFGNLKQLQRLDVSGCPRLQNLDGLGGLLRLEELHVEKCDQLKELPNLGSLTCLVSLKLNENISMEEVGGLSATLKIVTVARCGALKKFPDLTGLMCLERLKLLENESLEEMEGGEYHLSSSLKQLSIIGCESLRSFPSLEDCMQMQTLTASARHMGGSLEKLVRLESVRLIGSETTRRGMIFCEQLTQLQDVSIEGCDALEFDAGILNPLVNLKRLTLLNCKEVERIGQMSKAPKSLVRLEVRYCAALADMGDLSGLQNLVTLIVWYCSCLKKVEGYPRRLRHLEVQGCEVLEEMGDVSGLQNLVTLLVMHCPCFKKVDGLTALFTHTANLRCLHINQCNSFEAIKIPHTLLHSMAQVVQGQLSVGIHGNDAMIFPSDSWSRRNG